MCTPQAPSSQPGMWEHVWVSLTCCPTHGAPDNLPQSLPMQGELYPTARQLLPPLPGSSVVSPLWFLWCGMRAANHLIDWLSSYPKHDLKNKMKFVIDRPCLDGKTGAKAPG